MCHINKVKTYFFLGHNRMKNFNHILFCVVLACALNGCTPYVHRYGFNFEQLDVNKIEIGKDTNDTVLEKLGSPSSKTVFPNNPKTGGYKWFYIAKKAVSKAFFTPEPQEQKTVVIAFNNDNKVTDIKTIIGLVDVEPNTTETESTGYETSMIRDMFGNFGKYSGKKSPGSGSSGKGE